MTTFLHRLTAATIVTGVTLAFVFKMTDSREPNSAIASAASGAQVSKDEGIFRQRDRVVFVGNTFAERESLFGYLETALQARYADLGLTFRNLAYSADTPRVLLGDIQLGSTDNNRVSNRALNFGTIHEHLDQVDADVILLCFGMNESFAGPAGLDAFRDDLAKLVGELGGKKYNGTAPPRFVLVGPTAHEDLGGQFPDPAEHNKNLKLYSDAMAKVAGKLNIPFVDLFTPTFALMNENGGGKLTINGIHLNEYGYWATAQFLHDALALNGKTMPSANVRAAAEGKKSFDLSPAWRKATEITPPVVIAAPPPEGVKLHPSMNKRLAQFHIEGLPAGKYALTFGDKAWHGASAAEWAKGVTVPLTPFCAAGDNLRHAVVNRNREFFYRYRAVNGEYIYGRRVRPFGIVNFPKEMAKLDEMCRQLDQIILSLNSTPTSLTAGIRPTKDDVFVRLKSGETAPPEVGDVYQQRQGVIGGKTFTTAKDLGEAAKHFKVQDGFEINLFASEKDFALHNPLAMAFDTKGRLWISTMPSYPHYLPGYPPNDKILILEDTDGDGKADKQTVFADKLYLPTGFAFGDGGVYVAAQPNMLFLKDTDGDDKADERKVILHGFGSGDSHHAMHTFVWGPGGGLFFQEGIFHRSNVETPWGPVRQHDAGIYRFQPRSHKLEVYTSYNFANPWGHVFDRFGENFIADASPGANYYALPITGHVDFPGQHPGMKVFTSIVRPTCGCELISSRQFPPESQGNFLVNNNIGFQGIKQHKVIEEGSGFISQETAPLLFSTDGNFRPVGIKTGPDGAIYVVDWFNPLIGHMQFSIRDKGRDHFHGRIWRITAKNRPLVKMPKIAGQPIPALLDALKEYENNTRYWVRSELRERDPQQVAAALKTWIAGLDPKDADLEHHLLEALWVYQNIDVIEPKLLTKLLRADDYRVRCGATRALRHWHDRIPDALKLLEPQADDKHPRVRLETVVALSVFRSPRAAEVALLAVKHPRDYYLDYGLKETMKTLEPYWRPLLAEGKPFSAENPAGANYVLANVDSGELLKMARSGPVYVALLSRDGILPQFRNEALKGLAKLNGTSELTELVSAIQRLDMHGSAMHGSGDAHGGHGAHVLSDLGHLLTARTPAELARHRTQLAMLAEKGHMPIARQLGYVALVTADGSFDPAWNAAAKSVRSLRDLVDAVPIIPDAKLRASAYDRVKSLLTGVPASLKSQIKGNSGTQGRYVRIEIPALRRTLTLAEVEVLSEGVNIARKGKASQSSTAFGGSASRAIDGNRSGAFADGGQTHTRENERFPWWEVDLGSERPIDAVVIWNRSENNGEYAKRLDGFRITVLDEHRKPVFTKGDNPAPAQSARINLDTDPARALKLAALSALPAIPGHEAEVFNTIAGYIREGADRNASVRALRRIPASRWPKDQVEPLAEHLLAVIKKVPAKSRTEADILDMLALGNSLANQLPGAVGKSLRGQFGELGVQVVLVRTVPHKMIYDRSKIYVEAGKPAIIVLENNDIMPHNFLVVAPGALAEIGLAAEKMSNDPNAFAKGFVPESKKVLLASQLLQPRGSERIQFVAPDKPGQYPYVCTFPGHWRTMNGVLHVVPKLADVPASELNPPIETVADVRSFVRNWTVEDLIPALSDVENNRDFKRGKELFTIGTCIQCHKMRGEGGEFGPDLTEVPQKLTDRKLNRIGLLTEVIEPSKVIDDKYRPYTFLTGGGQILSGVVLHADKKFITVAKGPREKSFKIAVDDIEERIPSKVSIMPTSLLVTFNREEILDLLAYVVSGGDPKHRAFQKQSEK